ncbi:EF-hand domain-containing protein [Taklimakanibacter lacteus]|uniref:EF-hand domain-containing protein n=1 Tax=Taklimakanibacter lacteus TaxID=2268456 RepID=UPI000E667B18
MLITLPRAAVFAAAVAAAMTAGAFGQTTTPEEHHPAEPENMAGQGQGGMMGQMGPGMMGGMGSGMMGGMMQPGMMGAMMPMRGHMMKIMFAIADTNGDGGLSFEEVTALHKRIFDKVDADKDGKVTPEELQTFMRE